MRKFDYDNLAITPDGMFSGVSSLYSYETDSIAPFGQTSFPLPLFAAPPQPLPLFADINGTAGNDTLNGTADDDTINGLAGDDVITGGAGADTLNGGDGNDAAVYSSDQTRDYTVTEIAAGEYTVEAIGGTGEGTDTLTDVEFIRVGGINGTDYAIGAMAAGLGTGTETISLSYPFSGADGTPIVVELRGMDFDNVGSLYVSSGAFGASYDILYVSMNAHQLRDVHTIGMGVLEDFAIYFSGVIDTLDLSYVQLPSYRTSILGTSADETVLLNDENAIAFYGGAGSDTLLLSYDSSQYWTFSSYENPDDVGIDVVDFSNLGLVDDGAGGTLGELTFDLANSRVTQTGLSLSTDSYANVNAYETFIGWDGVDVFIGDERDNLFIGNQGDDTAVYSSSDAADYNILEFAPGQYYVEAVGGTNEGTDTLTGVETIRLGGINGTDYAIDDLALNSNDGVVLTLGDDFYWAANPDGTVYALGGDDVIFINATFLNDSLTVLGGTGVDTLQISGEDYAFLNTFGGTFNFMTGEVSGTYDDISFDQFEVLDFLGGGFSDTVTGGNGNDTIHGGNYWENDLGDGTFESYFASDFLYGMGGDDILNGSGGSDTLDGGDGNDVLIGGFDWTDSPSDNDTIIGGAGLDTVVYESANIADYILTETAPGEYTIEAIGGTNEGIDTLTGIEFIRLGGIDGADFVIDGDFTESIINLTPGDDDYTGTSNAEVINGLAGDDIINGGAGDDTLNGDEGDDALNGGAGRDILNGGAGADAFDGGTSSDTVTYALETAGATVDLLNNAANTGSASGDTFLSIENLIGSDLRDVLRGSNFDNMITGGGGDDNLQGRNGDDTLIGDEGDDTLNGGHDNDILIGGTGDDSLAGSTGNDVAIYSSADTQDYHIRETARLEYTVISLNGQNEGTDVLSSIETIRLGGVNGTDYAIADLAALWTTNLTSANDDYTGTADPDTVYGLEGDDIMHGLGGDDYLYGGDGNDTLNGGEGADYLHGDDGIDTASYTGASERVLVDIYVRTTNYGALGDRLFSIENLTGSEFNDILRGDNYNNYLSGGAGSDNILGRGGDDTLIGGVGDDVLSSGLDDDTIFGGEGSDTINGGAGEFDVAVYFSTNVDDYIFTETAPGEYTVEAIGGTGEGTDTLRDIETIRLGGIDGTDYAIGDLVNNGNTINGTSAGEILNGTPDDDIINGFGGDDIIRGYDGNDILNGGTGDDSLNPFEGDDTIDGGEGVDKLVFFNQDVSEYEIIQISSTEYMVNVVGYGANFVSNIEIVSMGGAGSNGFTAALANFDISFLAYYDTININLTSAADSYMGTAGIDAINGLAGDDILFGFGGDDIIFGGAGDDIINGGEGADVLIGREGFDTLSYEGAASGVIINLRTGTVGGAASGDQIFDFENIIGTDFADNLVGTYYQNTIMGAGGDDIINGSQNTSSRPDIAVYTSSDPSDYIVTFAATVGYTIEAVGGTGEGTDTLIGIETIRLGGINGTDYDIDTLVEMNGVVNLTNGDDIYNGTADDEVINALEGEDIIDGGAGNNTLNGDAGDDILISLGNDILNGGSGNDTVEMGGNVFDAATATDGGADIDTLSFSTLAQFPSGNLFLVIDLNGGAYSVRDGSTVLYVDQFTNFENATGSEFRDLLQGDAGVNVLSGLGGDDNLQGRDGDDLIDGGAGADILNGGGGMDTASYASALAGVMAIMGDVSLNTGDAAGDSYIDIENITGSSFDDILGGDANANIIDGGAGRDIASYAYASSAIVFDGLGLVTASGDIVDDTFVDIEGIAGTAFDDRLFGDNDASIFYGGEGADRLFGRNGDDELYGEGGNDIILGGRDNDLIDGGAGNDQLRGNEGDDTIFGGDGNDVLAGGAGADVMDGGAGIDRVEYTYGTNAGVTASLGDASINSGDAAGDTYVNIENLYGTTFADTLYGDEGNNRIDGRLGDDMLFGGDGNDYLIGGAGNDVMNGEGGNDLFLGQAGADIYQFDGSHGTDRIVVFTQGEDLIEFTENVFDFSALTITQDGAHVNIVSSEGTIIVNNSLVADFTVDDFTFATPPANEPLGQKPLDTDLLAHDMIDLIAFEIMFMDFGGLV